MLQNYKALPPTYILSPLSCFSKKRLFEEICALAARLTNVDESYLMRALNERESWGSTMCVNSVGLPHAVIPELKQSIAILSILPEDIGYNTVDSDYEGVNIAFAFFFSPEDDYEIDAEMLRLFSSILRNPDLANSFRRNWQDQHKLELLLNKVDLIIFKDLFPEKAAEEEAQRFALSEEKRLQEAQAGALRLLATQQEEERLQREAEEKTNTEETALNAPPENTSIEETLAQITPQNNEVNEESSCDELNSATVAESPLKEETTPAEITEKR